MLVDDPAYLAARPLVGGAAPAVGDVRGGAGGQQQPHYVNLIFGNGLVQCRALAIPLPEALDEGIDVGAALDEVGDRFAAAGEGGEDRSPFKKRSTDRVEMLSIIPRRTDSRATSPGVQWLNDRCAASGSSQAMAIISRICSGLMSDGRPHRGASARISQIRLCTAESDSSPSTTRSWSCDADHRRRHLRTIGRVTTNFPTICSLE